MLQFNRTVAVPIQASTLQLADNWKHRPITPLVLHASGKEKAAHSHFKVSYILFNSIHIQKYGNASARKLAVVKKRKKVKLFFSLGAYVVKASQNRQHFVAHNDPPQNQKLLNCLLKALPNTRENIAMALILISSPGSGDLLSNRAFKHLKNGLLLVLR